MTSRRPPPKKREITRPMAVVSVNKTSTETWCFRFDETWASFHICEATGDFFISSDYGSFHHSWPSFSARGNQSVKAFLARTSGHYVIDKLGYGRPREFADEFDEPRTLLEITKQILKARRANVIGSSEAREMYDGLDELASDDTDERSFVDGLFQIEGLSDLLGGVPWEWLRHQPSWPFLVVRDRLFPAFRAHLRQELQEEGSVT